MSFYRETHVKAVRKSRPCIGCGRMIEVGSPALDASAHYEGDFWAATYHVECRAAETAINDLHEVYSGEWMALSDIEHDDWDWLIAEHPVVAARMGITAERSQEAKDRWARYYSAARQGGDA